MVVVVVVLQMGVGVQVVKVSRCHAVADSGGVVVAVVILMRGGARDGDCGGRGAGGICLRLTGVD